MKNLDSAQTEQLIEIIQKKPAQRIVHFSDSPNALTKQIHQFCQKNDNEYFHYCTQDSYFDTMQNNYPEDDPYIHIIKFNLRRPRYLMRAIEFDYLISTLNFEEENKSDFLEKCYPIIRTGGKIILLIPNSDYAEKDAWREALEIQYYVSVNIIENIFNDYDVIVATRMHGWGD